MCANSSSGSSAGFVEWRGGQCVPRVRQVAVQVSSSGEGASVCEEFVW